MDCQEDIDFVNDQLYTLEVPNEPIKNIMFFFNVLKEVIDFPFPENYLNYIQPYFSTYDEMEHFFALAVSLNPDFLYHHNVIIYHNDKSFYKYYQLNDDQNGKQYEFKIVNIKESSNPIFKSNYINAFNISNIDKNEAEFNVEVPNKVVLTYSGDNSENTAEEHYFEEEEEENNFQPDHPEQYYSINADEYEDDENNNNYTNFQDIQKFYDENHLNKNTRSVHYENQMDSENELDYSENLSDEFVSIEYRSEKVKIKNKLIVTNEWIDYIYNNPMKEILSNMKAVIKSDKIRSKSISLPRNVFFYLEIIMLALLVCCASTLLSWSSTLKNDRRFVAYQGKNLTNDIPNRRPRFSTDMHNNFNCNQMKSDLNEFFDLFKKNSKILNLLENQIDYYNDSIIVPEPNKSKKIHKGCQLGETSGIFAIFFFVFIIYMCIRVAREKKAKYQKFEKKNKVGLNMCHIIIFSLLTLLAFVLTLVAEIYISISIAQHTYKFIHDMVRTQLILNSIIFVCYILIILFYFKI